MLQIGLKENIMIIKNISILTADTLSGTNRLFPLRVLENVFAENKDRYIPGRVGMPLLKDKFEFKMDVSDCAFMCKLTEIKNGSLFADITVLDTVMGRRFQSALNDGLITNPQFRVMGYYLPKHVDVSNQTEVEYLKLLQVNYTANPA
jgi:hypothetical protein